MQNLIRAELQYFSEKHLIKFIPLYLIAFAVITVMHTDFISPEEELRIVYLIKLVVIIVSMIICSASRGSFSPFNRDNFYVRNNAGAKELFLIRLSASLFSFLPFIIFSIATSILLRSIDDFYWQRALFVDSFFFSFWIYATGMSQYIGTHSVLIQTITIVIAVSIVVFFNIIMFDFSFIHQIMTYHLWIPVSLSTVVVTISVFAFLFFSRRSFLISAKGN